MNPLLLLETAPAATAAGDQAAGGIMANPAFMQIIMLVGMLAIMYFLLFRPQKKRQKQEEKMRNELRVGDSVVTIGGIMGKIITIKEDSLIIETGVDRCRMQIKKWAIQANTTTHEDDVK